MDEFINIFKCFICNNENSLLSDGVPVPNNMILKSGTQLRQVVEQILGYDIADSNSVVICTKCQQTCEEYDQIVNRLSSIKNQLTGRFQETKLKLVKVKLNPEETTSTAILPTSTTNSKIKPANIVLTANDKVKTAMVFKTKNKYITPGTSLIKRSKPVQKIIRNDRFIKLDGSTNFISNGQLLDTTVSSDLTLPISSKMCPVVSPVKLEHSLMPSIDVAKIENSATENEMQSISNYCEQNNELDEKYLISEVEIMGDDGATYGDEDTILLNQDGAIIKVLRGNQEELLSQVDSISLAFPEEESATFLQKIETEDQCDDASQVEIVNEQISDDANVISDPDARTIVQLVGSYYKCLICAANNEDANENIFKSPAHIMVHIKSAHNLRFYACDVCGDSFRRKADFDQHLEEHLTLGEETNDNQHCCKTCNNNFASKRILQEHEKVHLSDDDYVCSICNKSYTNKYTYSAHIKIHSERNRPYRCPVCNKRFYTLSYLMIHEKTHDPARSNADLNKCDFCPKTFSNKYYLDKHRKIHLGEKLFHCGICTKRFARKIEVEDHVRTHTGERPFRCDICGKTFSQKANLFSHKRHTHTDEKRYGCHQCEKKFKRKRLLLYHIQSVHTKERPYRCEVCAASFIYPEHFRKHRRLHTGEKPYECEVCHRGFTSRDNRNIHRFTHSAKKQFECVICGAGYMRRPQLMAHMSAQGHLADMIIVNQAQVPLRTTNEQLVEAEKSLKTENQATDQDAVSQCFGEDFQNLQEEAMEDVDSSSSVKNVEDVTEHLLNSQVVGELLVKEEELSSDELSSMRLVQVELEGGKTGWISLDKLQAAVLGQMAQTNAT